MNYYNFHSYSYHIITTLDRKYIWKEEGLVSHGSSTPAEPTQGGAVRSGAFWGEVTQMQRVPEKAPPHTLQNPHLQEGLEAMASKESRSVP